MLYYFLYQFVFQQYGRNSESYFFKGLNVIQYVTFRTAMAAITSLLISLLLGGKVIRKLADLKFGQEITRRGACIASGKARHADNGRCSDHRFGFFVDNALGAA